jgi:acyl-CoA oxidase
MAPHDAWNHSAIHLIKGAQAHARYVVADCFVRSIKEGKFSDPVRFILNQLCELLLTYWLVEHSGDFFMVNSKFLYCLVSCIYKSQFVHIFNCRVTFHLIQFADLSANQLFKLQSKYMELLGTIRTYAVNLVDSFDIRDEALDSVLGCWDGNAYQRLFDEASKSPLNKTSVHRESFEKYLKPLMKSNL